MGKATPTLWSVYAGKIGDADQLSLKVALLRQLFCITQSYANFA